MSTARIPDGTPHAAKHWVEEHYPKAMGGLKSALILAYGAGLDAGLAEAQQMLESEIAVRTADAAPQDQL